MTNIYSEYLYWGSLYASVPRHHTCRLDLFEQQVTVKALWGTERATFSTGGERFGRFFAHTPRAPVVTDGRRQAGSSGWCPSLDHHVEPYDANERTSTPLLGTGGYDFYI
jgi:hypothetical protein